MFQPIHPTSRYVTGRFLFQVEITEWSIRRPQFVSNSIAGVVGVLGILPCHIGVKIHRKNGGVVFQTPQNK